MAFAIEPKSRADEDKISGALHKILEEDPSLHFDRDPQTNEFILSGSGQLHIETVVKKPGTALSRRGCAPSTEGSLQRDDHNAGGGSGPP
ncbi:MAG: hypothetical protein IPI64_15130 [Chloracidobacterium sp.]|nr:hypothetical protein [Chloracidobacterium sp.]